MKLKGFLSVHILLVFLLLGYVYYVTVFVFIEERVGLQSSAGLLHSLFFTFFASMCVLSFLMCVLTDPGGVPSGYVPDLEDNHGPDQEFKRSGVHSRHCDKCSVKKPPRAHHCRTCRRCVLRMDHHCSWINNCVGHKNYKAFLLLVFYAAVAGTYSAIVIISCTLQKDWDFFDSYNHRKNFHIGCGLIIVSLSLLLGSFLVWNLYLASHNLTTIEYHEGKRAAWLARKSGLSYHHPYDVGPYRNMTLILGPNILTWLWPTATSHIKDGLGFPASCRSS